MSNDHFSRGIASVQGAFAVLAIYLLVAGFSLSVSASAIPPRFRIARSRIAWAATLCIAGSVAAFSWVTRS